MKKHDHEHEIKTREGGTYQVGFVEEILDTQGLNGAIPQKVKRAVDISGQGGVSSIGVQLSPPRLIWLPAIYGHNYPLQ